MSDVGFDILFEDADCLVVAKPGGLLTQAPLGIDSLEYRIKQLLKEREPGRQENYLGVPHRLDRPVSGVIVFAKHAKSARKISQQFERRLVEKTYWAIVTGDVQPGEGTWTDHVQKVPGEPRSIVVPADHPEGQIAILHYRVRQRHATRTLLDISLETGRTHQIRIQCASRGFPVLGDELYGSREPFGPPHPDERERLIALHARTLTFRLAGSREDRTFVAPVNAAWREQGIDELLAERVDTDGPVISGPDQ
jgi:23S rRNA pseudouridine1911/1915/1917 synthase